MEKIKKFLLTVLSVSLVISLGIGYKKNCSAMEHKNTVFSAVRNHGNIPRLEVGPGSSKKEILDALTKLKNQVQTKLLNVDPDVQKTTKLLIDYNFFTSQYNVRNATEITAAKVGHDWLDAYYRYSFIRTINGDVGDPLNFAGYIYTMLRNSGFESYVVNIKCNNVKNINNEIHISATVVKLDDNWYCIPCVSNCIDKILTLEEFLYLIFEKGWLFAYVNLQHVLPNNKTLTIKACYDVTSKERARSAAFYVGNRQFNESIDALKANYIPAHIFNVAI